jgi:hypothetical protein
MSLSHVAMSVPEAILTDEYRAEVLRFYGELFDWREMEALRLDDRMTIAVGGRTYINIRARRDAMTTSGYEHFGVTLPSSEGVEAAWQAVSSGGINAGELQKGDDGYRSFKFQHLLPLSVEVQHFP